ncbi:MAG: type II secretion system protein GspK [Candidatus Omnitrophota bacterium]|nr:type II secretion system protein GspK [Candidatus Omnitrophota bacterium]MDZ4243321.1 type II secretion system protein GspK [Candidatus Omnitrophota bacterium]
MKRPRILFRPKKDVSRRGSILVLALWTLALLTVFAVHIALQVRQKITLLSRLEKRARLSSMVQSGVTKAVAVIRETDQLPGPDTSAAKKMLRFNNPEMFKAVPLGGGTVEISQVDFHDGIGSPGRRYGVADEDGMINVNTSGVGILSHLIAHVTGMSSVDAVVLARAIVDWREPGSSELEGFYSDSFYENLRHPYQPKKADFEVLDELLLVQGMTPEIYGMMTPFVTVYSHGQVNINTASPPVLAALGMGEPLVTKILMVRRGPDGQDATLDDYIFQESQGIPAVLVSLVTLEDEEIQRIDGLVSSGLLGTWSTAFRIQARASISGTGETKYATCVFAREGGKIIYWRE